METEKGLESGLEMIVTDPTIMDKNCPIKAILPYNNNGMLRLDALTSALRPSEELELMKLVVVQRKRSGLSVWDKLPLGLVRSPLDTPGRTSFVTGTSFPLTPIQKRYAKQMTAHHNLPSTHPTQMQVVLTLANGDADWFGGDWENARSVVCLGDSGEWANVDINRDYTTPKTSPTKGNPVARQIVNPVMDETGEESEAKDEDDDDENEDEEDDDAEEDPAEAEDEYWVGRLSNMGLQGSDLESNRRKSAKGARMKTFGVKSSREPKTKGAAAKGKAQPQAQPDYAIFDAPTGRDKLALPNIWYVPDGDDVELSTHSKDHGWTGGTDVYAHTIPGENADVTYWQNTYNMMPAAAAQAVTMAKSAYWPRRKGVSPGKVMAQTETSARITCSFTKQSSGSPVSRRETPLAVMMMHYRAKRELRGDEVMPSNIALKLNAPEIVLSYARHIVPQLLEELEEGDWPAEHGSYMKQKLARYLKRHKKLLKRCDLWDPCQKLIAQKLGSTPPAAV